MRLRDLTCAFCLSERSALRFDKKGRPYFSCGACGTRCFVPALREAVRHLAIVEPLLHARVEQLAADADDARCTHEREVAVSTAFASMMRPAAVGTPAQTNSPADAAEARR